MVRGTGRPPRTGPDRAVRRASRRRWRVAARRQARARQARRPADGRRLPGSLFPRTAPHRPRARCRADPGRAGARLPDEAAGRRHASDPVPRTGRLPPARGSRLHRRGLHARRSAPAAPLHGAAVLQVPGRDGATLRRRAGRARQLRGDRAALQPRARARQAAPAGLPDAGRHHARRSLPRPGERWPREAPRGAVSGRGGARAQTARLRRATRSRAEDDREDGLFRLLPDRRGLHQLGEDARHSGGAGARLRRRFPRGVLARHHGPRSAALRTAVRALPQPRARVDARLRHRLLPGQPRPRDRLREAQVRPRRGVADRHLRHARREGGGARRRPRARPAVHEVRHAVEADPAQPGRPVDARPGARRGARLRRGGRRRRGVPGTRDAGPAARGPDAQRRHARRRRADRSRQAHGLLSAVLRAGHRVGDQPVRQGRRRGDRAREVRLPWPHHADDPRPHGRVREAARSVVHAVARNAAARRSEDLRRLQAGGDHRDLPVRIARHARAAEAREAGPPRGPDRPERAVPARSDGPDPGLHRAQARPPAGRVPRIRRSSRSCRRPTG